MRINTNTAAMNTYSRLGQANKSKSNSLAKLSSGLRINKAGDDAAGLAISEKMKNQISGMKQATRNAQDGISLIQTAEGALNETHSILNRMRDLTVQASNDTNTADDKKAIQSEIDSLTSEIDRIAGDTEFNTQGLMNGGKVDAAAITSSGANLTGLAAAFDVVAETGVTTTFGTAGAAATALNDLSESDLTAVATDYNTKNDITAINSSDGTITGDTIDLKALASAFDKVEGSTGTTFADETEASTALKGLGTEKLDSIMKEYNTEADITAADIKSTEAKGFSFHIGANAGEKIDVSINNMSTKGLKISDIDVTDEAQTTDQILEKLDKAISSVSTQRANLGAVQNRLDHTVSNLSTTRENLNEANSRIRDVDMAEEMMDFTKSNILSQASTAMLAQANQMPQGVLQLLG